MSTPAGQFAAVLERRGRFVVAQELFGGRRRDEPARLRGQLAVDPAPTRSREGDLVLVRVAPGRRGGRAEIVRRIGRPDVARDVIEALLLDRGLRRDFGSAVEDEAAAAGARVMADVSRRRDLRELPTFTIDPADARDFDDAVSAEALGAER
ncbi:MAG TPA: RNB domain-containing ribonuclease, partial [Solirubrobacteraceae bacterium]|nr:RNB domain-containing ribonuclease [Solirubrobacteraceae bacterium]